MPLQQILPTWLAWNNANFTSPTGLTDVRTGQPFPAGGLGLGDYFDATEKEANACSALNIGLLHSGRYRLVQLDPGATAANVMTGTMGYVRSGSFVQGAVISNPGTGGTPGTYTIPATPGSGGGGSGAVLQVVVGATGTIASVTVPQGGFNYASPPTFPLTVTGVTGGAVSAQLNSTPNIVTSADVGTNPPGGSMGQLNSAPRPVIFLNPITPGNFGFIQELGLATVLASGGGNFGPGSYVLPNTAPANGQVTVVANFTGNAIGQTADYQPAQSQPTLVKFYMSVPVFQD